MFLNVIHINEQDASRKMVFLIHNTVQYFTTEARRIYEYIWKKKDRDVF